MHTSFQFVANSLIL